MQRVPIYDSEQSLEGFPTQAPPCFSDNKLLAATASGIVSYDFDEEVGRWHRNETVLCPLEQASGSNVLQLEALPDLDLLVLLTKEGLLGSTLSRGARAFGPLPKTKGATSFSIDRRLKGTEGPDSIRLQLLVLSKRRVHVVGAQLRVAGYVPPPRPRGASMIGLPDEAPPTTVPATTSPPPVLSSCSASVLAEVSTRETPTRVQAMRLDGRLWLIHAKGLYRLGRLDATPLWGAGRTETIGIDEGVSINLPAGAEPASALHGDQLALSVGQALHLLNAPTDQEEFARPTATLQLRSKARDVRSAGGSFLIAACDASIEVILAHKSFGCHRVQELALPGVAAFAVGPVPRGCPLAFVVTPGAAAAPAARARPGPSLELYRRRPAERIIGDLEVQGDFDSALDLASLLVEDPAARASLVRGIRGRYAAYLLTQDALPEALMHLTTAYPEDPVPLLSLLGGAAGVPRGELEAAAEAAGTTGSLLPSPATGSLSEASPDLKAAHTLCLPYLYSYRSRLLSLAGSGSAGPANGPGEEASDAGRGGPAAVSDSAPLAALVDAALIHVLAGSTGDFAALSQLIQRGTAAPPRLCEDVLRARGLYAELAELQWQAGEHREALGLLQKLAGGAVEVEASNGKANELKGASGAKAMARYLLALPPSLPDDARRSLVLEFSVPVLEVDQAAALDLFARLQPPLPPRAILDHLKALRPELAGPYLEGALRSGLAAPEDMDHELAVLLLDAVTEQGPAAADAAHRERLRRLLLTSPNLRLEPLGAKLHAAEGLEEEGAIVLLRSGQAKEAFDLLLHHKASRPQALAAAERLCAHFASLEPQEGVHPAAKDGSVHASLCPVPSGRLWLSLLACLLRDEAATPAPPAPPATPPRGGKGKGAKDKDTAAGPRPPPAAAAAPAGGEPPLDVALRILARWGDRIEPIAVLDLLPESVEVSRLIPYLERLLPSLQERRRGLAMQRNLLRVEELRAKADIAVIETGRVQITWERACSTCHRRIGLSAFAVLTDGSLVHLQCREQKATLAPAQQTTA